MEQTRAFEPPDTKARILAAALEEFSAQGYAKSSTNRIVKRAGVSKGILFKHFRAKKELYFILLDQAVQALLSSMSRVLPVISGKLFERIEQYAAHEMAWLTEHPAQYRLIHQSFTDKESPVYQRVVARYQDCGLNFFDQLMQGVDTSELQADKQTILNIFKWFLQGFNQEFLERYPGDCDPAQLRKAYSQTLKTYLAVLKSGMLREEN